MLFDPVIPLFGIPPKDIIAREKSYTCTAVYSNIIYNSKIRNEPKGLLVVEGRAWCIHEAEDLLHCQGKWQTWKSPCGIMLREKRTNLDIFIQSASGDKCPVWGTSLFQLWREHSERDQAQPLGKLPADSPLVKDESSHPPVRASLRQEMTE